MDRRPVPTAEQLPHHGATVLAFRDAEWWQANFSAEECGDQPNDGRTGWYFVGLDHEATAGPVTHWMPMLRAPRHEA
jgi:hypothetical protein